MFTGYVDELASQYESYVSKSSASNLIISSEQLTALSSNEIGLLKGYFDRLFDEVRIVVFLRDPLSKYFSNYQTNIMWGDLIHSEAAFDNRLRAQGTQPELLCRWSRFYGNENFRLELLDKNTDLVMQLGRVIKFSGLRPPKDPTVNQTFSLDLPKDFFRIQEALC